MGPGRRQAPTRGTAQPAYRGWMRQKNGPPVGGLKPGGPIWIGHAADRCTQSLSIVQPGNLRSTECAVMG